MREIFLCHHLGLGDHIITNGLTRELLNTCDIINYPVKYHNVVNVMRMFEDVDHKINFLPVSGDSDMLSVSRHYTNVIRFGIFSNLGLLKGEKFCEWYRS